jgi:hypothetical protein
MLLEQSGFIQPRVFTRGDRTEYIAFDSVAPHMTSWNKSVKRIIAKLVGVCAQLVANVIRVDNRGRGDEIIAIAHRHEQGRSPLT